MQIRRDQLIARDIKKCHTMSFRKQIKGNDSQRLETTFKCFVRYLSLREVSGVVVLKLYDTDPYFSKIRTYWEVSRFKTRDVYVGWPDPYSFRFGLFPRRGKSDFGTRH